jgi:hypothetical protein
LKPQQRNRIIQGGLAAAMLLLAGCASSGARWPFKGRAAPPPQAVAELAVELAQAGAPPVVLQYWERNTLVVDLTSVAGAGRVSLRPNAERGWPVRIAFRMAPRRFEVLEVRGAQRMLLPVAAGASAPVTAELPDGVYVVATPELLISWGAADSF